MDTTRQSSTLNRRSFLRSAAAAGAGFLISPAAYGQAPADKGANEIRVALLGAGSQGMTLMNACLKIPKTRLNLRFRAVCDIWEKWNLQTAYRTLKKYGYDPLNAYTDYQEMLDKEKDLDAVIIATPDFWHAEHTVACLNKGLHVYCEKEMSNTLDGAKKMVEAAKKTGKLLQIGHQRRSNPRYIHCYDKLIKEAKLLGRITTVNGQWNRSIQQPLGWVEKVAIDQATLEKFGFKTMEQFRNWRWYKGLGGGPIVDLGSHQIDIYSWFLGCDPQSVIASGGTDYYPKNTHQWYDTVMAIYEYNTPAGLVRAFYQTITTNSCQGYFETFMGDQGTLVISEASSRGTAYHEPAAPDWEQWVKKGYLKDAAKPAKAPEKPQAENAVADSRESPVPPAFDITATLTDPYHMPHLANFFEAVLGKAKLNCPAEEAYKSAVAVLKVNQAIEAGCRQEFKPEEFKC
jgi:predicted dehydrogenase